MKLEEIEKMVKKIDPKIETTDEGYKPAVVLLSAVFIGADAKKVAAFTKLPLKLIQKFEKNLRESKVWVGNKTFCDWENEEDGGIAFWCDVLVAQGMIKRVESDSNGSE